ncbi:acetolactate synthase AlsS [Pedobacter sp. AW31-3R]|uniref:acetolactate synthase AlsS n=1 Tax=Pedobacter sp. AW31-3R TaxID=3445781 RepID=UPI003F9F17A0
MDKITGAELVVKTLEQQKVKQVFGIPGAKIDPVFDKMVDSHIQLVVCRHEQNAAFMAAAIGRITGAPGVCMTTSGPGATNLVTGLVTANTEGDPMIAISGTVKRSQLFKRTHQSLDAASIMRPVTKMSVEIEDSRAIPEVMTQAFRMANTPRKGAAFICLPNDVITEETDVPLIPESRIFNAGPAPEAYLEEAAKLISGASLPVILAGQGASDRKVVEVLRRLLDVVPLPIVGTFQAVGIVPRELEHLLVGRVGLFPNQPGDVLLAHADVILTIGYDPVEYGPQAWNKKRSAKIIHLDHSNSDTDFYYQPELELIGDIAASVKALTKLLKPSRIISYPQIEKLHINYREAQQRMPLINGGPRVHPLHFIRTLRRLIGDDVTVTCDIGSHYIWMARYFDSFEPNRLLFSNGQQTLGVALPWAIAAAMVHPHEKVISISGDGGFLFSAMELETAVRLQSNIIHFVWTDGTYDMVGFQEVMKYGRSSGIDLGRLDVVKHAESYGAVGFLVRDSAELEAVMRKALTIAGPVIVDIPIDYRDNIQLGKSISAEIIK